MSGKNSKALFIEGESSEAIASLRQGFNKLFTQLLAGKMPKIYMGDGISTTIRKFKKNQREGVSFLLIDLDAPEAEMEQRFAELDLSDYQGRVFWMVQEMESWFLSQPEVVDKIYGKGVSNQLKQKRPQTITKPSAELMELTKSTKKGKYSKVRHAVEFLENLDATQLKKDFPEFKRLIDELEK